MVTKFGTTAKALPAKAGFTFGCDPELFVLDETGRAVSAAGLFPGNKIEPHPVKYGAIQVDGMAAEFNIEPVSTFKDFDHHISFVLKEMQKFLPKGYSFSPQPATVFEDKVFAAAPPEAKELGCQPDFNAWTGEMNPPPKCTNKFLRTAAGHLHIGWTKGEGMDNLQHIMNCRDLVRQLDWYLGGWSVKEDPDPTRRLLYGKAGACRYKDYGVEYRVLSNFWVFDSAKRLAVWNRLQTAIQDLRVCSLGEYVGETHRNWLIDSINNSCLEPLLEQTFRYPLENLDPYHKPF